MCSSVVCSLSLSLLFYFTFFAKFVISDLISSTCNHTRYYDICMSSLQSHSKSRNSDIHGIAEISLDLDISHAKETISYIKRLKRPKDSSYNDTFAAECIGDCMEVYVDALVDLRRATDAFRRNSYHTVNILVAGAMTGSDSCESGFSDQPGFHSPMTERNVYFFKLCSNTIAITNLLV